jgi:hypothetical protein
MKMSSLFLGNARATAARLKLLSVDGDDYLVAFAVEKGIPPAL